jgi:hypothetical protein
LRYTLWTLTKKQGKLRQTLDQEVANANPANRIYHDSGSLCEAVLETHLETSKNIVDRRNPLSRGTGCYSGVAVNDN